MKNQVTKYLIENKQLRLYLLSGKQIYSTVKELSLVEADASQFIKALNITALVNVLTIGKQRISFTFSSKNKKNKLSTDSFSNHTITGTATLQERPTNFKKGTIQTISSLEGQFGSAHTSYSLMKTGDFYSDIEAYFADSEQTPTYFYPISTEENAENIVLLLQPLPFAQDEVVLSSLEKIEVLRKGLGLATIETVESNLAILFSDQQFLGHTSINYHCGCSKQMFLPLIFSLRKKEVEELATQKENLEAICPLCGKSYTFLPEDILFYLQ
ncbi:Hsp33 family molecular chaperone HslO [Enterococcus sp. AZ072]|uniref:Hsp33 family molecular chaperone HslO n=1 Tax=unclassified Enterococcus TaxID=2608891 RepID=UPI003D2E5768